MILGSVISGGRVMVKAERLLKNAALGALLGGVIGGLLGDDAESVGVGVVVGAYTGIILTDSVYFREHFRKNNRRVKWGTTNNT